MSALEDAVTSIRRDYIGADYISRVKASVANELRTLDPTVKVEDTQYFNHSAIPDFVLSWAKDRLRRNVYIRGSYASILSGHDVADLPAHDPVFVALDKTQEFPEEPTPITPVRIREESAKAKQTLLTDVAAVGSLREVASRDGGAGPVAALVQSNFVRGARGLVDDDRAGELTSTGRTDGRTTISEVLRETFSDEAFLRMERTAAIVDLALASSPDQATDLVAAARLAGRLSDAEVSAVLPWVLSNPDVDPPAAFWSNLGALIEFEDLEKIASRIESVNITRFIAANSGRWRVKRAYVGALDYSDPDRITRAWQFRSGVLTVDSDYHRVHMASSGRTLRGRTGAQLPRWSDIQAPLTDFRLQTVDLQGVLRRMRVDAAQSEDIRADAQSVTESLQDDYRVQSVGLRFLNPGGKREYADANVDLSKVLAVADAGVTIEEMLRTSLRVLAHRSPVSLEDIAAFTVAPETDADSTQSASDWTESTEVMDTNEDPNAPA